MLCSLSTLTSRCRLAQSTQFVTFIAQSLLASVCCVVLCACCMFSRAVARAKFNYIHTREMRPISFASHTCKSQRTLCLNSSGKHPIPPAAAAPTTLHQVHTHTHTDTQRDTLPLWCPPWRTGIFIRDKRARARNARSTQHTFDHHQHHDEQRELGKVLARFVRVQWVWSGRISSIQTATKSTMEDNNNNNKTLLLALLWVHIKYGVHVYLHIAANLPTTHNKKPSSPSHKVQKTYVLQFEPSC